MDMHRSATGEAHQQVLAVCLHHLEPGAVDLGRALGEPALGRAGRQRTPRELIEVAGEAVVQVAFGHPAAISSRTLAPTSTRSDAQVSAKDDAVMTRQMERPAAADATRWVGP
jgi:hypothetical protein